MRVMARAAAPTSGAGRTQTSPDVPEARPMAASAADRSLLFGLLALQNGLIDHVQLVAAFQSWTRDKARPLAEHLVARGDLDAEQLSHRTGQARQGFGRCVRLGLYSLQRNARPPATKDRPTTRTFCIFVIYSLILT